MNRGIDYYSLLHQKEQLLAQLDEIEVKIQSRTHDFFNEPVKEKQSTSDSPLNDITANQDDADFGVLISDEDLFSKSSEQDNFSKESINEFNVDFDDIGNANVLKAGKPIIAEGEFQYKNKKYQLEFIKTPLLINGYISKVLTLVKNKTEKSITHVSALLKNVFDTMDDFIVVKDLNQKIISANDAYIKAIGKKNLTEIAGLTDYEIIGEFSKYYKSQREDQITQKLKKGETIESEAEFLHSNGSLIDVLVKRFPVYDNDRLIATASIFRDITSLKNEHRKLIQSEEKYRMIIENQGEGACIIDSNYQFIFANSAAEKLFDVQKHGLIDKSLVEFLKEDDFSIIKTENTQSDKKSPKSFELEIASSIDTKKYVLLTLSPFFNDNNQLIGSFALFRDITERRRIEEELLKSQISLKETIATKDKFFSIIAHDLKNPFGTIMGFSELILRKQKSNPEKIEHYAKVVHSASKRGFELLENLLAWSRSQNGTLKYSPTIVSLSEIIDNNIDVLKETAEKKQISIINLDHAKLNVFIDEDMVNTVFRNLLSNAIKYSNSNSRILITPNKIDENYAEIAIADEGIGMQKSTLDQLFRIDTNKSLPGTSGEEGTGLGLILCKEFIEKNKGKIWADSTPNEGSTFYISLPIAK